MHVFLSLSGSVNIELLFLLSSSLFLSFTHPPPLPLLPAPLAGLNMARFREVMRNLGVNTSDEDLNVMFMKVDASCVGKVFWEEIKMYLLLENEARDSMHKSLRRCYFPEHIKILRESMQRSNSKAIVGLQFYSFKHPQPQEDQAAAGGWADEMCKNRIEPGQYMSITQDGKLSYWTENLKHMYTLLLDDLKQAHAVMYQKIWVTHMICMRNIDLLAISSTSNHLEFYDISARKCTIAFTLTGVEPVTVMDYWSNGKRAVFSVGDTSGGVTVFTSCDVGKNGIFNRRTSKTGSNCHISMAGLLKNKSDNHFCFKVAILGGTCQQIRFLANLNIVASCAAFDKTAMVLTRVPDSHKSEIHHSIFKLPKGIMCFDYSPELNILVTGGSDRMVRVWNPYVTKRACSRMEGHLSVITDIVVNGRDKKVISISRDKNLRIWDLHDYTCLQKIRPSEIPMGRPPITALHYTRDTNTLVIATSLMGVLQGEMEDLNARLKESTHKDPVCTALYNTHFKQVVSGCYSGVVCVWDILTGDKAMEFLTSPGRDTEMTVMAFDGPQRRLLTGASDGAVRLWNFNNGVLLLKLPVLDKNEVTGILNFNNKIYISGWSKRIICYKNVQTDVKMEHSVWMRYHTEDIYSIHAYGNKMVVTASYNGDIIVWNTSTEDPLCWFNASQGPRPLLLETLKEKATEQNRGTPKQPAPDQERATQQGRGTPRSSGSRPGSSQSELMQDEDVDAEESEGGQGDEEEAMPNLLSPEELAKPSMAVEKALFLGTRTPSQDTAVLLTCTVDGYVCAWSICDQGGLLGRFRPTQGEDTTITAMSTDPSDQILLTGDSHGFITLWDIKDYCCCMAGGMEVTKEPGDAPGLSTNDSQEEGLKMMMNVMMEDQKTEVWDGLRISVTPPKQLSSWQCHLRRVIHVGYVEGLDLLITAGLDCNVRLWTVAGSYIGTYGQVRWRVEDPSTFPKELPADLKRLGAPQAKDLDEEANPEEAEEGAPAAAPVPAAPAAAPQGQPGDDHDLTSTDVLPDLCVTQYCSKKVEETWREWQEKGKVSKILGQAYKPKVTQLGLSGHLDLPTSSSCHEVTRISKFLPCSPLLPVPVVTMPDTLKKQHKTQEEDAHSKQKCRKKPCPTKQQPKDNSHA
ncbi:WD repeat-containing protein on Y chromosome-like [Conger conger]|uniref:WD repeat-containing protein on Y chromosome-like n=1 Tax=Conger conger TaxID=82655 RepID=UPI002A5A682E|nr:WD repeat-containing protein on Y chromosome-like [Conger conger]